MNDKFINREKGFTLVEMMVSILIFAFTMISLIGLFVRAVEAQRIIMQTQRLLDQVSYALEYTARAIRMAQVDDSRTCILTEASSRVYRIFNPYGTLEILFFRNYENACMHIGQASLCDHSEQNPCYLNARMEENPDPESNFSDLPLTSQEIDLQDITFLVQGDEADSNPPHLTQDSRQPLVTIFWKAVNLKKDLQIEVQTSVSQRNLDF